LFWYYSSWLGLTWHPCDTEFRVFVEAAERQLFLLFKSIDRDNDGKLDKNELQAAFHRAGLSVPMRRLGSFFEDMDKNNDGYISFDEWR
jgi:solute carrier family 25 phosphate transporter 23/24/25/41